MFPLATTSSRRSPPIIRTCRRCPAAPRQSDFERQVATPAEVRYERATDAQEVQQWAAVARSVDADGGRENFDAVASRHHRKRNGVLMCEESHHRKIARMMSLLGDISNLYPIFTI